MKNREEGGGAELKIRRKTSMDMAPGVMMARKDSRLVEMAPTDLKALEKEEEVGKVWTRNLSALKADVVKATLEQNICESEFLDE